MSTFLKQALEYAELGYPVFPLTPGQKFPLAGSRGFKEATTDPKRIEIWWSITPNANIGIWTKGLIVIDDDRSEWLTPEVEDLLADAPKAETCSGGSHFVFLADEPYQGYSPDIAPNVDTKGDGGYILAFPSIAPTKSNKSVTGRYRWVDGRELPERSELCPLPDEIREQLGNARSREIDASLGRSVLASRQKIAEGERHSTFVSIAGALRNLNLPAATMAVTMHSLNEELCHPKAGPLPEAEIDKIVSDAQSWEVDEIAESIAWGDSCGEGMVVDNESRVFDPGPIPDELLTIPGFIEDVTQHTLGTCAYPNRALAFAGALVLQGTLAGRRVRNAKNNRTNLYVLALGNTGIGKNAPRETNNTILSQIGGDEMLFNSFASGPGIEDQLENNPAVLFQYDEFDTVLNGITKGETVGAGISKTLLEMFTNAHQLFKGRTKSGGDVVRVEQPCLSVLGTAIPKVFFESLSQKMLSDGLFSRLMVIEAGRRPDVVDFEAKAVPDHILDTANWWKSFKPGLLPHHNLEWIPDPKLVEPTPEAKKRLFQFARECDYEYDRFGKNDDQAGLSVWNRAAEKAGRLSLIYACSQDHQNLRITMPAVEWACSFVRHTNERMLYLVSLYGGANQFEKDCKQVAKTIEQLCGQSEGGEITATDIARRHRGFDSSRRNEILRTLAEQGVITNRKDTSSGGRPRRLIAFVEGEKRILRTKSDTQAASTTT